MPRRDLEPRARDRHGRRRPRDPGREPEVGRARPAADRPRRPRARLGLEGPHLPEVPRRPARVRRRRAGDARRRDRGDEDPAEPARRARAADRRDRRPRTRSRSTSCTGSSAARIRSPTSRAQQLENVLDMLAGRYPSDEFAELRPRIVWDRTAGVIRGRTGARRLAVTNAGTIPDRGLFGVHLVDGGGRVGELDEEMVYEARQGQTFMLGASTWRIEEITRDRVLVSPAPGRPGRRPVLEGRGRRPPVRARARRSARASRELVALSEQRRDRAAARRVLTSTSARARNLLTYLREQEAATGAVPSDRTIVVERFRDEIGDWRVCILTPFGGRVHAPWGMALAARLRDSLGLEAQSIWSDDGIALHLPEADAPPTARRPPDRARTRSRSSSSQEVGQTALFGARFRENASRALLIPRRRPGQRTPLWQQRLKAQNLLQVARKYGSFPIVLETYRECLQDVFDLPALKSILHGLQTRELDLVEVETASASPFASLAPLRLRRDVHVRGRHAARRAARAGALARPRPAARAARPGGAARADRPGRARRGRAAAARQPARPRRAARRAAPPRRPARGRVRRGPGGDPARRAPRARGPLRRRGAADRGRGRGPLPRRARRDAARRAARGVPRRRRRTRCGSSCSASRRAAARSRPPRPSERFGLALEGLLHELERADLLVRGELRPGGSEREWCDPDVLRRLRRASLAALRREVEPAEQAAFGRFLPAWHGIGRRASLREALVPLQGLALPVSLWESEVLPRRVPGYQPASLDALCAAGELVWVGAGPRPRRRLLPRGRAAARQPAGRAAAGGRGGRRDPARRSRASAEFWATRSSRRPGSSRRRRCPRSGSSSGRAR